eukprot:2073534-Prorocentrum_lima.AAC.1
MQSRLKTGTSRMETSWSLYMLQRECHMDKEQKPETGLQPGWQTGMNLKLKRARTGHHWPIGLRRLC